MNTHPLIPRLILVLAAAVFLASCGQTATQSYAQAPSSSTSQAPSLSSAAPANQLEAQVESVYTKVAPSVVQVTSKTVTYGFFMQPIPQEGTGSGFVYDAQGDIVTNDHVVAGATSITVGLQNGKTYKATVVGEDQSNDLAVLRIRAPQLPPPLAIADVSTLRVGQFVIALGNPFALNSTLTFGVVSALGRVIQSPDGKYIGEAIQTDAAINPGNSGGPLLNLNAQVIGVTSQILSPSGANAGIGFAISTATVRRVVPVLIAKGRYPHPWLGISSLDLSSDLAQAFKAAGANVPDSGMLIAQVAPGGPAARAGIRGGSDTVVIGGAEIPVGGDVITAINGKKIDSTSDLTVYLEDNTEVGQTVAVTILRGGKIQNLRLTLGERPASAQ